LVEPASEGRRRLIVKELGSNPLVGSSGDEPYVETVVVIQASDERPAGFASRVAQRVTLTETRLAHYDACQLYVGNASDPRTNAARRDIVRTLTRHLSSRSPWPELVVQAPSGMSPRARDRLLAAVQRAISLDKDEKVVVQLRVGQAIKAMRGPGERPRRGAVFTTNR